MRDSPETPKHFAQGWPHRFQHRDRPETGEGRPDARPPAGHGADAGLQLGKLGRPW